MGSPVDPHPAAAAITTMLTVSMFIQDWLALAFWLRHQHQSSSRRVTGRRLSEHLINCFPDAWQALATADGSLQRGATLVIPDSFHPFLLEFGGEPAMAAATRVWIDGTPVPLFTGRPHLT